MGQCVKELSHLRQSEEDRKKYRENHEAIFGVQKKKWYCRECEQYYTEEECPCLSLKTSMSDTKITESQSDDQESELKT